MAEIETTGADIRALKDVDYVSHHIDLPRQENLIGKFCARNPRKVVPVLVHNGRTCADSNDIIDHIDMAFDAPKLSADNPKLVAVTQELLAASVRPSKP